MYDITTDRLVQLLDTMSANFVLRLEMVGPELCIVSQYSYDTESGKLSASAVWHSPRLPVHEQYGFWLGVKAYSEGKVEL